MDLKDFMPQSKLVTKATSIEHPRFQVIDAHNHIQAPFGGGWEKRPVQELLDILDEAHVQRFVDLDGGWGESILQMHLDVLKSPAPDRFYMMGGVDWSQWGEQGDHFGEWAAGRLREQVKWGAEGLKMWKPFGLHVKDHHGQLVAVDDRRLDPIWETAGELGLPVLIHIADPVAFFDPIDHRNERIEELGDHPDWHFPSPPFPPFLDILNAFYRLVKQHPHTTFIGAHVGCYAENLAWVGTMLDDCPNYVIDFSARLGELGRAPYSARRFFINYADRILFGTDSVPSKEMYGLYYRFLETDDEYFNYSLEDVPPQGRWQIYGLYLPDEVLRKIYYENAKRILKIP